MRALACLFALTYLVACGSPKPANTGGSGGAGGTGGVGGTGGTGGEAGGHEKPRIDQLQPDHGKAGDTVTVVGVHFDPDARSNAVLFGTLPADVVTLGAAGTELSVTVPQGVVTAAVHVTAFGLTGDGPVFTVENRNPVPMITGADPATFAQGDTNRSINVTGSGIYEATTAAVDGLTVQSQFQQAGVIVVRMPDALMRVLGPHALVLHNPAPGGGDSIPFNVNVAAPLRVISAAFASPTTLAVQVDQDVKPADAQPGIYYTLSPALRVTMGVVTQERPRMIVLQTDAAPADTTYTLTVDRKLKSAMGVPLGTQNTATFRSFDALPDPTGTFTPPGDCSAKGVVGPAGLWGGSEILLTEFTGNQVQKIGLDGTMLGFFGSDGQSAGFHATGTAAGCPGGSSDAQGALVGPVGAAVQEASGGVVVADTGNGRVLRYPTTGGVEVLGRDLTSPALLGLFGHDAYVAEPTRMVRVALDGSHGPLTLGGPGTGDFEFAFATDSGGIPAAAPSLATPAGSRTYIVVDPGNNRVQRTENLSRGTGWLGKTHEDGFATGGTCCDAGSAPGQFTDPRGLALLASGVFYVIDGAGGGRLQKFDADGKPLRQVALGFLPEGMSLADDGTLWIAGPDGSLHRYVP